MITKGYKLVSVGKDGVRRSVAEFELPMDWIQVYEPGIEHNNNAHPFFAFDAVGNAKAERRVWIRSDSSREIEIWECSGEFDDETLPHHSKRIPLPAMGHSILLNFWDVVASGKIPWIHSQERRYIPQGTIFAKKIKLERKVELDD